jgi:transcription elongation GreA/GreB family factor
MSRAFVKEDAPDNTPLPDLPLSPHPNYVTPRGLAALQARRAATQADRARLRARADRLDRMPEAAAERDIRYLEARLRSARPVDPSRQPQDEVAFGARVTVTDADGHIHVFEITGEDEADAAQGRIAPQSPLARALLGAAVGDSVLWVRPAGKLELEITAIHYGDAP